MIPSTHAENLAQRIRVTADNMVDIGYLAQPLGTGRNHGERDGQGVGTLRQGLDGGLVWDGRATVTVYEK